MNYPVSFFVTVALLGYLFVDCWRQRRQPWALPMLMVYLTVTAWYFVDLILYGEKYKTIPEVFVSRSYWEVAEFLVSFRLLVPWCARKFSLRAAQNLSSPLAAENILYGNMALWGLLFIIAISQLNWDFLGALFPLDSRNGALMWQRAAGADAGPFGFLISTGGYLYLVACSFFGILAVMLRRPLPKLGAVGMILVTWPFFLMSGTRNQFLAVCMPWVFTYALFSRHPKVVRLVVLLVAFLCLESAFRVVISHRGTGFRDMLAGVETAEETVEASEHEHEGLNMLQELCYINIYSYVDMLDPGYGVNYLAQLVSVVPRAIWANKPLQGIDYAKWRGFEDTTGNSDIGVVATISTGLIGQGVLEFGPLVGPLAPGALMALWCGLLARWWNQRQSLLRLCLFLLGVGITFNLGRNITMIILWPVAFAYLLVLATEKFSGARASQPAAVPVRPPGVVALRHP